MSVNMRKYILHRSVFADGGVASVFSSYDESTVDTHFRWMKRVRFRWGIYATICRRSEKIASGKNHFNKVLASATKAADKYDRAICVMYDLSGMKGTDASFVLDDIDELTRLFNIGNREKRILLIYSITVDRLS